MASGPTPANVAAIRALLGRGESYRSIERALGLGGSGRGIKAAAESKPGANLTEALQDLVAGRAPRPIARRTAAGGRLAAVRQPVATVPSTGSAAVDVRSSRSVTLAQQLAQAVRLGQHVQLVLTFTGGEKYGAKSTGPMEVELFSKGGWAASNVQEVIRQEGSTTAGLKALALAKPGVERVGSIMRVQLSRA